MIERLAIFGATGDLTARYLLPGGWPAWCRVETATGKTAGGSAR